MRGEWKKEGERKEGRGDKERKEENRREENREGRSGKRGDEVKYKATYTLIPRTAPLTPSS